MTLSRAVWAFTSAARLARCSHCWVDRRRGHRI